MILRTEWRTPRNVAQPDQRRASANDWGQYVLPHFSYVEFSRGQLVLDLGCGHGEQLLALRDRGCVAIGIDSDWRSLVACSGEGSAVARGVGEALPVRTGSVDGVVCKAVLPYTDEFRTLAELARVLKKDGVAQCCYIGAGYYLRYLLIGPRWKYRFYGLRTLLNSCLVRLTGFRLPGFLGDTVYQTRPKLGRLYKAVGLRLLEDTPAPTFLGLPVFIYHAIAKCDASSRA
jgi:SAM-dependent methyltransferase